MKVKQFSVEDSKKNRCKILVAECENGERYIVSGDPYYCPTLVPYDSSWDAEAVPQKIPANAPQETTQEEKS